MNYRDYKNYDDPREAAAVIAAEVVRLGYSDGWSGDVERLERVGEVLAPYRIRYVDDMRGIWKGPK